MDTRQHEGTQHIPATSSLAIAGAVPTQETMVSIRRTHYLQQSQSTYRSRSRIWSVVLRRSCANTTRISRPSMRTPSILRRASSASRSLFISTNAKPLASLSMRIIKMLASVRSLACGYLLLLLFNVPRVEVLGDVHIAHVAIALKLFADVIRPIRSIRPLVKPHQISLHLLSDAPQSSADVAHQKRDTRAVSASVPAATSTSVTAAVAAAVSASVLASVAHPTVLRWFSDHPTQRKNAFSQPPRAAGRPTALPLSVKWYVTA